MIGGTPAESYAPPIVSESCKVFEAVWVFICPNDDWMTSSLGKPVILIRYSIKSLHLSAFCITSPFSIRYEALQNMSALQTTTLNKLLNQKIARNPLALQDFMMGHDGS